MEINYNPRIQSPRRLARLLTYNGKPNRFVYDYGTGDPIYYSDAELYGVDEELYRIRLNDGRDAVYAANEYICIQAAPNRMIRMTVKDIYNDFTGVKVSPLSAHFNVPVNSAINPPPQETMGVAGFMNQYLSALIMLFSNVGAIENDGTSSVFIPQVLTMRDDTPLFVFDKLREQSFTTVSEGKGPRYLKINSNHVILTDVFPNYDVRPMMPTNGRRNILYAICDAFGTPVQHGISLKFPKSKSLRRLIIYIARSLGEVITHVSSGDTHYIMMLHPTTRDLYFTDDVRRTAMMDESGRIRPNKHGLLYITAVEPASGMRDSSHDPLATGNHMIYMLDNFMPKFGI